MTINHFKINDAMTNKSKKGFTLIEALVAIAILLIVVVAPISLIGDSLHKLWYARDEALSVNLAQEGIEMVREVRDSNMLSGSPWLTNLADGVYKIDVANFTAGGAPNTVVIPCPSCGPLQPLYLNASGIYEQGTVATPTRFWRIVTISSAGLPANERQITSTVTWQTSGSTGTVSASEYIFSWAV